jgi:hypothetical protein
MCVRTDENPEVFVLCGFYRPGANAIGETRKNSKKWQYATFSTFKTAAKCGGFIAFLRFISRLHKEAERLFLRI